MKNRTIDIAYFDCPKCGHRSTPPEAINSIAHRMDVYEKKHLKITTDPNTGKVIDVTPTPQPPDDAQEKTQIETKHQGNSVSFRNEGDKRVARLQRSYSKIAFQDNTVLEESDHIVIACPQCNTVLYEARWRAKK